MIRFGSVFEVIFPAFLYLKLCQLVLENKAQAPNTQAQAFLPALFFYYQMIKMKQKEISQKKKDEINKRVIEATKHDLAHIQELKSN